MKTNGFWLANDSLKQPSKKEKNDICESVTSKRFQKMILPLFIRNISF
jgi:hypothetical protein